MTGVTVVVQSQRCCDESEGEMQVQCKEWNGQSRETGWQLGVEGRGEVRAMARIMQYLASLTCTIPEQGR